MPVQLHRFGLVPYGEAWRWQDETAARLRNGGPEAFALLQHPPVYTRGRRTRPEHLLVPQPELEARGAAIIDVDRGGDITFHGPGQIVGYPVLELHRHGLGPVDYVRALEAMLITVLARFDLDAQRLPGRPGVWTHRGKIAAIGVRVRRGISSHGFALNVSLDLTWFDAIIPCGLAGASVTSMEQLLNWSPEITAVQDEIALAFERTFAVSLVTAQPGPSCRACPAVFEGSLELPAVPGRERAANAR